MDICHWPFQEKKIGTKKVFDDLLLFYNDGNADAINLLQSLQGQSDD